MGATEAPPGAPSPTKLAAEAWSRARAGVGTTALNSALAELGVDTEAAIDPDQRRAWLRANVGALRARGALGDEDAETVTGLGEGCIRRTRAVPAPDGHALLRDTETDSWSWVVDPAEAPTAAERAMEAERGGMCAPVVVSGLTPPASLLRLRAIVRAMDPAPVFRRRLLVVQEDLASLASACASCDLGEGLSDGALGLFLGPEAVVALGAWFAERADDALPKRIVQLGDADPALMQRLSTLLGERAAMQGEALSSLRASNEASLARETLEAARERFRAAVFAGRALRVLVCTSRHSTYTRHSAEGLRLALETLGHDARVLTERDGSSVLTGVSYARAVHEHRPEFVVVINYPRSAAAGAIPKKIPHAMWVQDTMAHLFQPGASEGTDGWDVYTGATPPEMWHENDYRPEAALPHPVTACAHRFHAGPVDDSRRERFACDLAFVSHHAQTPESLMASLRTRFPAGAHAMLDQLFADARTIVENAAQEPPAIAAEHAISRRFLALSGRQPNAQEAATLLHQVMHPVMGRLFRHDAVAMASRVCARRGWSMRLYGNGWRSHPDLARLAHDGVEHGEDLRACYRGAKAHLHIDMNTLTHQRVFECVLSGGLPLVRVWAGALDACEIRALDELKQHGSPAGEDDRGSDVYNASDGALARRLNEERARLGIPTKDRIGAPHPFTTEAYAGHEYVRDNVVRPFDVIEVFGGVHDIAFTDEATLEAVLERAIGDRAWAEQRSAGMRESVRELCSTEAFAARLINHTARVLGWRELEYGDRARRPTMDEIRANYDGWSRAVARG